MCVTACYSDCMAPQVSLPRSLEASRLAAGPEAAPTLTLRGRQRAAALAALEPVLPAQVAAGSGPQAVTVAGETFTVTLTL